MSRRLRSRLALAGVSAVAVTSLAACGGGSSFNSTSTPSQKSGKATLSVLFGSSGDAETAALKQAAASFASSTGNKVTVTPASNLDQQLSQGFAGNKPPDIFYVDASKIADYASIGALYPYGSQIQNADDIYPSLRKAFTYNGKLYCAAKDVSTLALEINTAMWKKAGLSTSDIPTTWAQLTSVSKTIKAHGMLPLAVSPTRDRVDAFLVQAGGRLLNSDGSKATADSAANVKGLSYFKSLLAAGYAKYSSQVNAGWGGEAFGKGKAVMTIEGNWITGAMTSDYPKVKYTVAPLPAGPAGKGTLEFTNCWGIAAKSQYKKQAVAFVNAMLTDKQQLAFAKAFGVAPSRQSAAAAYVKDFPSYKTFLDGAQYGVGPVNAAKMTNVLADYDSELTKLSSLAPSAVLSRLQKNMSAALAG